MARQARIWIERALAGALESTLPQGKAVSEPNQSAAKQKAAKVAALLDIGLNGDNRRENDSGMKPEPITVAVNISTMLRDAWMRFTTPQDIMLWNSASDDWHCPEAENDLRPGGRFRYRMAARDGSAAFDFTGQYTEVVPQSLIAFLLDDGRSVRVSFSELHGEVTVTESFEPEAVHSLALQHQGWQAILNRFAAHCEKMRAV